MGIPSIAALTLREALRRRIGIAALVVGGLFLAFQGVGLYLMVSEGPLRNMSTAIPPVVRRQLFTVLSLMGLYATNWLVVLMTVLIAVDTLSGEIASGVMQSIAAKPIRRWEVVMGKWLGYAALITVFLPLLAGGVLLENRLILGFSPPNIPSALALMWLEGMVLLAVTLRAGASLSTMTAGITVLGLHILAFIGGWIEQIGTLQDSQMAVNVGVVASLVMPTEAMWRKAASELQGPLIGGIGSSPFGTTSVPSAGMVAYAALYMAVALAWAIRRFSRRDL